MRISAINNFAYTQNNKTNFNGLLIDKGGHTQRVESNVFVDYTLGSYGSPDEIYTYQNYTYYPFKNESKESIEKVMDKHNFIREYKDDYIGCYISTTELGKTLPFTEEEWNNLSPEMQKKLKSML